MGEGGRLYQQEYKGIGVRIGAQIIDAVILGIIYLVVGYALFRTVAWSVEGVEAAPMVLVNLVIYFLYFMVLEGTVGATVGKKALRIRVLRDDGGPCGVGAAAIRNILRVIDVLPFIYIVGMILVARSPKKQRLGDIVAHTVVVGAAPLVSPPSIPSALPSGYAEKAETKFCVNCGARIPQEAVFCPKCGARE